MAKIAPGKFRTIPQPGAIIPVKNEKAIDQVNRTMRQLLDNQMMVSHMQDAALYGQSIMRTGDMTMLGQEERGLSHNERMMGLTHSRQSGKSRHNMSERDYIISIIKNSHSPAEQRHFEDLLMDHDRSHGIHEPMQWFEGPDVQKIMRQKPKGIKKDEPIMKRLQSETDAFIRKHKV